MLKCVMGSEEGVVVVGMSGLCAGVGVEGGGGLLE